MKKLMTELHTAFWKGHKSKGQGRGTCVVCLLFVFTFFPPFLPPYCLSYDKKQPDLEKHVSH